MPRQSMPPAVGTIGVDIGKNTFQLVGLDQRGAIVCSCPTPPSSHQQGSVEYLSAGQTVHPSLHSISQTSAGNQETGCHDGPMRSFR